MSKHDHNFYEDFDNMGEQPGRDVFLAGFAIDHLNSINELGSFSQFHELVTVFDGKLIPLEDIKLKLGEKAAQLKYEVKNHPEITAGVITVATALAIAGLVHVRRIGDGKEKKRPGS